MPNDLTPIRLLRRTARVGAILLLAESAAAATPRGRRAPVKTLSPAPKAPVAATSTTVAAGVASLSLPARPSRELAPWDATASLPPGHVPPAVDIPAELSGPIPTGDAAKDPETSRAVAALIDACARRYATVQSVRASGTYIQSFKQSGRGDDSGMSERTGSARVDLLFARPGRIRIAIGGKELGALFVADGTTVTQAAPSARRFRRVAQPADLAQYVEEEFAGELFRDDTDAVMYSVVGALMMSADPRAWLHAQVDSYIYEGVEQVNGRPAWRLTFLQSDPELSVVNWIDQRTHLIVKVSVIMARTADGRFAETYSQAEAGRMQVAVFDRLAVDEPAAEARPGEFAVTIPEGWTDIGDGDGADGGAGGGGAAVNVAPGGDGPLSFLKRMSRAAARRKSPSISASLVMAADSPGGLTISGKADMGGAVTALAADAAGTLHANPDATRTLALARSPGRLALVARDGEVVEEIAGPKGAVDLLVKLPRPGREPLLVAGREGISGVAAFDTAGGGRRAWTYSYPGERVFGLAAAADPDGLGPSIYVAFGGGLAGLRRLDADGAVKFASRRQVKLAAVAVGRSGAEGWRVVTEGTESGSRFTAGGRLFGKRKGPSYAWGVALDDSVATSPLLSLTSDGDGDWALRRTALDGDPAWSVNVALAARKARPAGLAVARLALGADTSPRPYAVAALNDGRLVVVDGAGAVAWRGRVAVDVPAPDPSEPVVRCIAAADLDGDGTDEVYVGADTLLLTLTGARPEKPKSP